ncbi:MAG TPA: cupin domain-containing protein [Burkholderiales bacterium]|nr:cupin domain-containing protein [Burkholderiales bacterium]
MTSKRKWVVLGLVLLGAGSAAAQQAPEVRRVVTQLDSSGKAVVMIDESTRLTAPRPPNYAANIWVTDKNPPDFSSTGDRGKTKVGLVPPKSGTVFRVVDFAPDSQGEHPTDMNHMMKIVGAGAPKRGLPPRHPMMHRTRTLDYAIILSGEIDMLLDDSEVHLKAGDVLVQQATNHAWVNRSGKPCRVAFILIDSQEP